MDDKKLQSPKTPEGMKPPPQTPKTEATPMDKKKGGRRTRKRRRTHKKRR